MFYRSRIPPTISQAENSHFSQSYSASFAWYYRIDIAASSVTIRFYKSNYPDETHFMPAA
jgi:hypothetical protein